MQTRRTTIEQASAEIGDHLQSIGPNRVAVVAEAFQSLANPARNFRAAIVREPRQLGAVGDRHDAGHDGQINPQSFAVVHEAEVGVRVVEILGDGAVGAGLDLAFEVQQVMFDVRRLGMKFRVGGDFDVEVVAGFGADEFHQFVGVAKFAKLPHPGRQIAAQGDYLKVGDPLFRLVSNTRLRAHLPFPEAAAQRLQRGQKVRLASPLLPGKMLEGEIEDIRPTISDTGRAVGAIAGVDNPDGLLKGGGSVDAAVVIGLREAAVMVPEQSVVLRPAGKVVYAIVDGKAEQRVVQTGGKQAGLIEIVSGLKADETVALDGAGFLTNGAPVTIQERGAKPASAPQKPAEKAEAAKP